MTGRDLILYILENHLEDKPVFEDGKIIGLLSCGELAQYYGVGGATVQAWIKEKMIDSVKISGGVYIPASSVGLKKGEACTKLNQNG